MCLIVAKPKGINLPKEKKMKYWFASHPDGFGLAFVYANKVRILKGALTINEMQKLLKKLRRCLGRTSPKDIDILFHFRQATTGKIAPFNCHPFPVTRDTILLASSDVTTDIALVHNGIIDKYSDFIYQEGIYYQIKEKPENLKTDTQQFIEDYLVELGDNLFNPSVQKLIQLSTSSKFALLSSRGISYIGQFFEDEGCWYSNSGYKPTLPTKTSQSPNQIVSNEYAYNEYAYEEEGLCDVCQTYSPALYYSPDDEECLLCPTCYRTFYVNEPKEEDRCLEEKKK